MTCVIITDSLHDATSHHLTKCTTENECLQKEEKGVLADFKFDTTIIKQSLKHSIRFKKGLGNSPHVLNTRTAALNKQLW